MVLNLLKYENPDRLIRH